MKQYESAPSNQLVQELANNMTNNNITILSNWQKTYPNYNFPYPPYVGVLKCGTDTYHFVEEINSNQFINNIKHFKDIFMHYFAHENIFFSCKCNKSLALLKYTVELVNG